MLENIRLAFRGIWSHKMRSFLTMLGIIIGIASIISIASTIQGTNEQIKQNLIGAGNNNVDVRLYQGESEYWMDNGLPDNISVISDEQKEQIRSLEGVESATFYKPQRVCGRNHLSEHQPGQWKCVRCGCGVSENKRLCNTKWKGFCRTRL